MKVEYSLAALASTAFAGSATVLNKCTFPVYYKLTGMGGMSSPVYTLNANSGNYTEAFRGAGSAIILSTNSALTPALTVEYSPNGGIVYYDLSNNAGNPFSSYTNKMVPSVTSCYKFVCTPNAPDCYSNGGSIKVKTCDVNTNLVTKLCAAPPAP